MLSKSSSSNTSGLYQKPFISIASSIQSRDSDGLPDVAAKQYKKLYTWLVLSSNSSKLDTKNS